MLQPARETVSEARGRGRLPWRLRLSSALRLVKEDFSLSFRSPYVVKWSLWWALATCGNFQVLP